MEVTPDPVTHDMRANLVILSPLHPSADQPDTEPTQCEGLGL